MSQPSTAQLSLPVHLRDDQTFASFFAGKNQQLVDELRQTVTGQGEGFVYFWGQHGAGRSHLLHACCALADELGFSCALIPLQTHPQMSPEFVDGLHDLALICVDDVQAIAGLPAWEEALFDLYNRIRERGSRLVVSADSPPQGLALTLPDLSSRLSWGVAYQLHSLDDHAKLQALQLRASQRGLKLPDDVGRFLLNRLARDMRTLFDTLEQLDLASMAAQRKLTIPFVKQTLDL